MYYMLYDMRQKKKKKNRIRRRRNGKISYVSQ